MKQAQALEKIGRCYLKLKDYIHALVAFKLQLRLGWMSDNVGVELAAYDNIGMAYFYLGDLEGAEYYHRRMINGVVEPCTSFCRLAYTSSGEPKKKSQTALGRNDRKTARPTLAPYLATLEGGALEKSNLLAAEIRLCTVRDETPKVVRHSPAECCTSRDLPSPRKSAAVLKMQEPQHVQSLSLTSATSETPTDHQAGEKYRAIRVKLKHITSDKVRRTYFQWRVRRCFAVPH